MDRLNIGKGADLIDPHETYTRRHPPARRLSTRWAAVGLAPTSDVGQKATSGSGNATAIVSPGPDVADRAGHVGFGPKAVFRFDG